jgi:predicted ATPase/DNA-binding winged helix-turn-helix (wHTH) protein
VPVFGHFELRPERRRLLQDGNPVAIGARAFDVLLALAERRERIVTKTELLDLAWPGLIVEENNLQVQISTLRKVLGPDAIATIPGRGYRFAMAPSDLADRQQNVETLAQGPQASSAALAPLIGRSDDLAALDALINRHRLIAIVGAGGMGKTCIARHLAYLHCEEHRCELAWIDLEAVGDGALVAGRIAAALSIRTGDSEALQTLLSALRSRSLLLVLDSAEHLIVDVSLVVGALLEGCPKLRVLVTTQMPLRLEYEHVYRLEGLSTPKPGEALPTPAEALGFGAVALFAERAQAADRRFVLTPDNLADVIDVCCHLDGMALALELAAARVHLLGVAQLRATLEDRLCLLTAGHRGAHPRLQTLRATLEWSYGLLTVSEQAVFRRLGVFVGGFTLELAQGVVADISQQGQLDRWAVLDSLASLVDRSLLKADVQEVPRYCLLESARMFAMELLTSACEADVWRRRHATMMCELLASRDTDRKLQHISGEQFVELVKPELENARAALDWAIENEPEWALSLAPRLATALTTTRMSEQQTVWAMTSPIALSDGPVGARAAWHLRAGRAMCRDIPARLAAARIGLQLSRRVDDRDGIYQGLAALLALALELEPGERETMYAEMKLLEAGSPSPESKLYGLQAEVTYRSSREEWIAAEAAALEILMLAERADERKWRMITLTNLIGIAAVEGRYDVAVARGHSLVDQTRTTDDEWSIVIGRAALAYALVLQGNADQAREQTALGAHHATRFALEHQWVQVLAGLAALEQRPSAAALLCGHADATYAVREQRLEPSAPGLRARAESTSRLSIGDARFECLRTEGASKDFETALTIALDKEDVLDG